MSKINILTNSSMSYNVFYYVSVCVCMCGVFLVLFIECVVCYSLCGHLQEHYLIPFSITLIRMANLL